MYINHFFTYISFLVLSVNGTFWSSLTEFLLKEDQGWWDIKAGEGEILITNQGWFISRVGIFLLNWLIRMLSKTVFSRKCTDGPGRRFRSLTDQNLVKQRIFVNAYILQDRPWVAFLWWNFPWLFSNKGQFVFLWKHILYYITK